MRLKSIFIDGIYVDPEIATSYFACDLDKCKGACCFMYGDFGAPLLEEEIEIIQDALPIVKKISSRKKYRLHRKKWVL